MAHRDSKTAIGKLDMYRIGEAYEGKYIETIDVPVLLIQFDKEGESNPSPTHPVYHFKEPVKVTGKKKKSGKLAKTPLSIITPGDPNFVRHFKDKLEHSDIEFRMTRKIARMTISDMEAHAIAQSPEYLSEVLINFKLPVVVQNKRSGLPVTFRDGLLAKFIELYDPDPDNPDVALIPEMAKAEPVEKPKSK